MRVLVIEDEQTLAGFMEQTLRADGYAVTVRHDGLGGEAAALSGDYALVLLDLTLPGKDGLEVLHSIRARLPDLPVIALTARAAIEQRVEGLDRGANDYVTKPFSFEELMARVRAQLRSPGQRESSTLEAAGIRMDLRTRRVQRDGRDVQLTAREFEVLAYLMRHKNEPVTREMLGLDVFQEPGYAHTNVIEVYINLLRKKVETAGRSPRSSPNPAWSERSTWLKRAWRSMP